MVSTEDEGCGCFLPLKHPPDPEPASAPARSEPPGPDLLPFLHLYRERLRHHGGDRDEPDGATLEEQARLREALGRYGLKRLEQMAEAFLESKSPLLHYGGYGVAAFLAVLPTLAVLRIKPSPPAAAQVPGEGLKASATAHRRGE